MDTMSRGRRGAATEYSVEDIKSALKEYGTIDGVYVARKLSKYSQRFAFVNFVGVNNKHDMETRMRNIRIGDERLFITLAKFIDGKILGREVKVSDVHHKIDGEIGDRNKLDGENKKPNEEKVASNENGGGSMHGYGGRSFRDTLINKQPDVDITVDPGINAFSIWCDRAVVGRAKDFQRLNNL
ncbi:putative RNA recognition motif domain, RNA-binding domain superfamily [Helianthus anomalus]